MYWLGPEIFVKMHPVVHVCFFLLPVQKNKHIHHTFFKEKPQSIVLILRYYLYWRERRGKHIQVFPLGLQQVLWLVGFICLLEVKEIIMVHLHKKFYRDQAWSGLDQIPFWCQFRSLFLFFLQYSIPWQRHTVWKDLWAQFVH